MMRNHVKCLAFLVFMSLLTSPCFPQTRIHVVTEDLPPLNYLQNDTVVGSATAIVRQLLENANLSYDIAVLPWARAYGMALSDTNTLIYSMNRTPDREGLFQWIGLVSEKKADVYLYALRINDTITTDGVLPIKKRRIAVINKDVNYDFLVKEGYENVIVTHSFENCLRMLVARRVDMIVSTDEIIRLEVEKQGLSIDSFKKAALLRYSEPYLAASKATPPDIIDRLRESYAELVKTERIPDFSNRFSDSSVQGRTE